MPRVSIKDFELANPIYRGASVTFYTVAAGAKTNVKATLYAAASGATQLANPQKLDSHGKFRQPVYIEQAVIGAVDGISIPSHDTGIIQPAPTFRVNATTAAVQYSFDAGVSWNDSGDHFFRDRDTWAAATEYERNDQVLFGEDRYLALRDHTSTASFATDLASGNWRLVWRQPYVNVKNYGATGDGVTDDAPAIQEALAVALLVGGGVVHIPRGSYRCGSAIRPTSNVHLKGDGIGATKLTLANSVNKDLIRNANDDPDTDDPDVNILISDMEIDGNKANQSSAGHSPDAHLANIRLKNVERCHVRNVYTRDSWGYGLEFKAAVDCAAVTCYASGNRDDGFSVSEYGMGEVSLSKRLTFVSCFAWGSDDPPGDAGAGFEVDDGPQDVNFIGCHAWDNVYGMYIHEHANALAPKNINVVGGSYSDNDTYGIRVNSQGAAGLLTDGVTLNGVVCDRNGADGIRASTASNVSLLGVQCKGNTARPLVLASCEHVVVYSPNLAGGTGSTVDQVSELEWTGGYLTDTTDTLLRVFDSSDFKIEGTYFFEYTDKALLINTGGVGSTTDGTVRGVTCRKGSKTPTAGVWISGAGTERIVVEDNDLRDAGTSPLRDEGTNTVTRNNQGCLVADITINADQNNYDPNLTGAHTWRMNITAGNPRIITGIAKGQRYSSEPLTIINIDSSETLVLANQSSSSTEANRIITGTGKDLSLAPGDVASLLYDTTTQRYRVLGVHTNAGVKSAMQVLAAVSGATVTATNIIPAGAMLLGVKTRIVTALGASNGTTGYEAGDGSDPNRFGAAAAVTAGTETDNADATADPTGWDAGARSVVLTASGGNFDGTGAVMITVHYFDNT